MKKVVSILLLLLLVPNVYAMKEVKIVRMFGGFFERVSPETKYEIPFRFYSPDGVSEIYYLKVRITADIPGDTEVSLELMGEACRPKYYRVSSVKRYTMEFDCTKNWRGEGRYEAILKTTSDIYNVYAEIEITYLNNPEVDLKDVKARVENVWKRVKKSIRFFGTEYQVNDTATIFLQLLENDQPVNHAECLLDLYYPDKTKMFEDVCMEYLEDSEGLYYFDMLTPNQTGIYMMNVKCLYLVNHTQDHADSFTLTSGSEVEGSYQNTWSEDGVFHSIRETSYFAGDRLDFYYEFTDITLPDNATDMVIFWKGSWDATNEEVIISLWNWDSSSWDDLPNRIAYYTHMVSNTIEDFSPYIQGGKVRIRFRDTRGIVPSSTLRTDLLEVRLNYAIYGAIEIIRGGGELHVTNHLAEIKEAIKSVNETVKSTNQSLSTMIITIEGNISDVHDTVENVKSLLLAHNSTVHIKLNSIHGDLLSHNDTVIDKLYEMQDNITSFYDSLAESLANVTNVTLNVSIVLEDVPIETWKTFLKMGTPPLMPSTRYYCLDNTTLVKEVSFTFCEDKKCTDYNKTEYIKCTYGCDPELNKCNPPPYMRLGIVIAVIVGMIIFTYIFILPMLRR